VGLPEINATRRGRSDHVDELLSKGAEINRLSSDGFTPLMRAAYGGHHDSVRILLERGADPTFRNFASREDSSTA
jgi:uncharacterized protein